MSGRLENLREIINNYSRHGWQLKRALLRAETCALVRTLPESESLLAGATVREEPAFDALWFARPSHGGREAWELRLAGQTPYALFETFEPDEEEEDREDVRREMEARLREYVSERQK